MSCTKSFSDNVTINEKVRISYYCANHIVATFPRLSMFLGGWLGPRLLTVHCDELAGSVIIRFKFLGLTYDTHRIVLDRKAGPKRKRR